MVASPALRHQARAGGDDRIGEESRRDDHRESRRSDTNSGVVAEHGMIPSMGSDAFASGDKAGAGGHDCVGKDAYRQDERESSGEQAISEIGGKHGDTPWCVLLIPRNVRGIPTTVQEPCQTQKNGGFPPIRC